MRSAVTRGAPQVGGWGAGSPSFPDVLTKKAHWAGGSSSGSRPTGDLGRVSYLCRPRPCSHRAHSHRGAGARGQLTPARLWLWLVSFPTECDPHGDKDPAVLSSAPMLSPSPAGGTPRGITAMTRWANGLSVCAEWQAWGKCEHVGPTARTGCVSVQGVGPQLPHDELCDPGPDSIQPGLVHGCGQRPESVHPVPGSQ